MLGVGCAPVITSCSLLYNSVRGYEQAFGGAVFGHDCAPVFVDCVIEENTCSAEGDYSYGGGVMILGTSATLTGCIVNGNVAQAGTWNSWGGGLLFGPGTLVSLNSCLISRNTSDRSGALAICVGSSSTITSCTIACNTSDPDWETVYVEESDFEIELSVISHNSGGLVVYCSNKDRNGIRSLKGPKWVGVASAPSAGIRTDMVNQAHTEKLQSTVNLSCCDIYGNSGGDWVGCIADQADINGNLSLEPFFCDTVSGDFHIDSTSPCAADNPMNLCGELLGALSPACQECDDNDGDLICVPIDNCPDIYNPGQDDEDGDEIGDVCDPCPGDSINDPDEDGLCANVDNCPFIYNPSQNDNDSDGVGDVCDNCPDDYNPNQEDTDSDGIGDACDVCPYDPDNDIDEDGICGDIDNCPGTANPEQEDIDTDDIGDVCDECTDTDNDGYGNPGFPVNTCTEDNCPDIANADQADFDGDGIGDVCDDVCCGIRGDTDHNGTCSDIADLVYLVNYMFQSGPEPPCMGEADIDGSGIGPDIADLVYLVNYMFQGGPSPVPCE